MFKKSLFAAVLGILAMLVTPDISSAQRRGGGGGRGVSGGGRGWSGGRAYYGGGNYGRGYYGNNWNRGWGGVYLGLGGYGWGYGSPYYGYDYSPNYYSYSEPYYYSQPTYSYSQPAYTYVQPSTAAVTEEESEEPPDMANRAFIQVDVPANAEIWFEGSKTNQTGAERDFVSPPLDAGKTFTYDIRARWTDRNGQAVDETRQVTVQAGRRSTLDFFAPHTGNSTQKNTPARLSDPVQKPDNNAKSNPNPKP